MKEVTVLELSSPGCHNCADFQKFWHSIEGEWPNVKFRDVSVTDPEGQEIVSKHMIMASPGIIINGELFSTGGVNKEKFIAKLKELAG